MFSPYYAWRGWESPEDHCALNIALYGPRGSLWAMTERGAGRIARDADHFAIASSALTWRDDSLTIDCREWSAPLPYPMRGRVRVLPEALARRGFAIDADARHVWRPIAPRARIEVAFDSPRLAWTGEAYLDSNFGEEPLERAFKSWSWQRAHRAQDSLIHYDTEPLHGDGVALALRVAPDGAMTETEAPPFHALPRGLWGMARKARADAPPRLANTWEDAPFYMRSALEGEMMGAPARIVQESLSLGRLAHPVVRAMLPFRMPRLA